MATQSLLETKMTVVKVDIDIPIKDALRISFDSELVANADSGDFYHKITAHVEEQEAPLWAHAVVARIKNANIKRRLHDEIMKDFKREWASRKIQGGKK